MSYFTQKELACKCCGKGNFSELFHIILDLIRKDMGEAMKVNSACRCDKHNEEVGGVRTSEHLFTDEAPCVGIDIQCLDSNRRWRLVELAIKYGIRRIGIGKTFVHLGFSQLKQSMVMWVY